MDPSAASRIAAFDRGPHAPIIRAVSPSKPSQISFDNSDSFDHVGRLRRLFRILQLRGSGYLGYLLVGYALPRAVAWMVFEGPFSSLLRRIIWKGTKRARPARSARTPTAYRGSVLLARDWLPEDGWADALERHREGPEEVLVLGEIDNDGRVRPADWIRGKLPDTTEVDDETFDRRRRHSLELVVDFRRGDGILLIRKDFRGDEQAFRHERDSLQALSGAPWSPEIYPSEERFHLYRTFVPGPTVRQILAEAGARILSAETDADPELAGLDDVTRIEAVWARGREFFHALPESFVGDLDRHLNTMHHRGVTGFSLTFGNIVLHPRNGPWFIDFDRAFRHREPRGLLFAVRRDRDRQLFNRIYGGDILTERTARRLAQKISTPYSPFDLGRGVASRGFWSVDSGTGRWEAVNRPALLELIQGKRILDLGVYSGLMPLLMLRDGARSVVAIERDSKLVETAEDLRRLFEWRYMRSFDGLDMRCADMRVILERDPGEFDLVTAFCSLYYLDEEDMRRMVRRAAELASVLVLQAKTDTRRDATEGKARKSSLEFLKALMEENGFPDCDVVAPSNYSRPLLIGRRG